MQEQPSRGTAGRGFERDRLAVAVCEIGRIEHDAGAPGQRVKKSFYRSRRVDPPGQERGRRRRIASHGAVQRSRRPSQSRRAARRPGRAGVLGRRARGGDRRVAERGGRLRRGGRAGARPRATCRAHGDDRVGGRHDARVDVGAAAEAGWQVLANVAPVLRDADVTAVNYEGTLATQGISKCAGSTSPACFAFRAPPENAAALRRAGVDVANLANNHALRLRARRPGRDRRPRSDGAGPRRGGTARARSLVRRVAGRPLSRSWASRPIRGAESMRDLERRRLARPRRGRRGRHRRRHDARRRRGPRAGAHAARGLESYLGEDRGDVRAFARAAIDAGADLVLGSGPHVLRGIELYRGRGPSRTRWATSAATGRSAPPGTLALSGVLAVRLDDPRAVRPAAASPRWRSTGIGIPRVDPAGQAAGLVSELGAQDFPGAALAVGPDGRLRRRRPDRRRRLGGGGRAVRTAAGPQRPSRPFRRPPRAAPAHRRRRPPRRSARAGRRTADRSWKASRCAAGGPCRRA